MRLTKSCRFEQKNAINGTISEIVFFLQRGSELGGAKLIMAKQIEEKRKVKHWLTVYRVRFNSVPT